MKIPLNWLRDYVELPASVTELAERLTLAGLEVTGIHALGLPVPDGLKIKEEDRGPVWDKDKIVIGKVLSVERHPNADRLTLATVEYGAAQPRMVVTGAPNIKVGESGQKVVLALSGSVLFDGHADKKVLRELKPSKIRGIASDAMVCSAYELGISEEHEGIILLDEDVPIGMALAEFMGDIVLEVDVTPNMARCLSIIGIAREVAALTGKKLKLPITEVQAQGEPIAEKVQVAIENPQLSSRYAAALVQGVRIGAAPGWMQRRLSYAGMRPINNIVDITNYVMLEWGQPLHAFDYDCLLRRANGKELKITVRSARAGEKITTLDQVVRELTPSHLVIADTTGPVAIAGVMGGADTEVSEKTRNVLLESANFNFISIRRTMKELNLPSEASVRFSRGIHAELVAAAAGRAAEFVRTLAAGNVCRGLADCYPAPLPMQVVMLEQREVSRILGMEFSVDEIARTLRALEFTVKEISPGTVKVTVPAHRLDIQAGSADLMEELGRIHGYDRLPARLLADRLPEQQPNKAIMLEERVRDILVNHGLQEVITYSLTEPSREKPMGGPIGDYIRLVNPISSERVVMRRSLLASVFEVAAHNLRYTDNLRIFEIGAVYLPRAREVLPDEPRRLAMVLTGRRLPDAWHGSSKDSSQVVDFYDMKGIFEGLTADLHVAPVSFRRSQQPFLHPGRSAEVLLGDNPIGHLGELHPQTAEVYGFGNRTVLVSELNLETLLAAVPFRFAYTPVGRFPAALRDIAVIVDNQVAADKISAEIWAAGGGLLKGIKLFDVYYGDSIPAGTKSLAYALSYQAVDRTLTDKEVDKMHKKIEDRLKHVLKAQIRGKEVST